VGRIVHISSTAVYGLPSLVPTPEDHPREPVDGYGRAKTEAEEVAEKFRADGMCLTIVRPKTFLGPGRMGLFAMLFEWAEEGRNFPVLGSGDVRIQMLAIEDLVAAVAAILAAPDEEANDTYNIAAAEFGTLRTDFQAVLDLAGHGKRVVSLPARPALAVLRVLERTRLSPVYGRLLHKLLADSYVSIDKARDRLGFVPQMSNMDAILRTYAWWRESTVGTATSRNGNTSRDAWRQGALSLAKILF
jgi:nucleoside-diphosphate-sugar epimerase